MREGTASTSAAGSTLLHHPSGLHARPAIKLTKLAKRFQALVRVAVSAHGPWTDAKSIAKVMALKVPSGVLLFFEADGVDAADALAELIALVDGDFRGNEDAGPR